MNLAESVLTGDRLSLSRLLTQVENDTPLGRQALAEIFPHTGRAHLIGVTGAPGTGKSSLVNQLARYYRKPGDGAQPKRVGIVAIDPSSPFTGGAILGDRIRMRDLSGDPGVFIRSMASRGRVGGLAAATAGVVQALDAAGYEIILIETIGAGQAEVDIARLAHTTLVVEAPGLGDEIQAIKAGILEIADILVVNKADRPGVENTERALRSMLDMAHPTRRSFGVRPLTPEEAAQPLWLVPIRRTVATEGTGIAGLVEAIARHLEHLHQTGGWQERDRVRLAVEVETLLRESLLAQWKAANPPGEFQAAMDAVFERRLSPFEAVEQLTGRGER